MKKTPAKKATSNNPPVALASPDNTQSIPAKGPQFGQPKATPDPIKFKTKHASDTAAYAILDKLAKQKGGIPPKPFIPSPITEPRMSLADAIGKTAGRKYMDAITKSGQIVFHALGDTGNTRSAKDENEVTDKLVSDFTGEKPGEAPAFCYNLGDVVYSFGEADYYYDQFYDPYRDYPAPIFAIAGNHDGMVAPGKTTPTMEAFIANFCAYGQPPHRTPQAGGLLRTANVQPAVYFTLEAPFVRIIGLYSNVLEDPGVISSRKSAKPTYHDMPDAQLPFLKAALDRVKSDGFKGAVIIAVHHPPYVAVTSAGQHGGSPIMLAEIDAICKASGVWPHAVFSGHAHNYQRFTRRNGGCETPYMVAGNGGHAHNPLSKKGANALRTPIVQPELSNGSDQIRFFRFYNG